MAVVMNLFSRMIIGYAVSCRIDNNIIINAFKTAYENRDAPEGVTFHSDQGSNYTSHQYQDLLTTLKIEQSFSKRGTTYDNSVIEAFFTNMKQGYLNNRTFTFLDDLKLAVYDYIKYYNEKSPHESLGFKTPLAFENDYKKTNA
nr:DDE-type integrase/transposase/recombinase [Alteracholeplasma palmae]